MIAFDTNVLVRLMVEDHPGQVRRARELLEEAGRREEEVFVPDIALAELEWVLESAYGVPRQRILAALSRLVGDERFAFEDRERVKRALDAYQTGQGDLADFLLGGRAGAEGARTTFTFDRALRGEALFTVVRG